MTKNILLYLKLIRYQNLILLAAMQLVLHFGFLKYQHLELALCDNQFLILVFATVSIAAAGYVINDIFDQDTDHINKPTKVIVGTKISEKNAYNIYFVLNVSGVFAGFYVSNIINKPNFAVVFIVIAASLYFYATNLKQTLLIGNLLVASLSFLSVLIVSVFDLYPTITDSNRDFVAIYFKIILDYAIFAFFINFLREIVKDAQDLKGDDAAGMRTLPIVVGLFWTKIIVLVIGVFVAIVLFRYVNIYYFQNHLLHATAFAVIFIVAPLLLFLSKIWSATTNSDFKILSNILKIIVLFAIISILIVTQNIIYHG